MTKRKKQASKPDPSHGMSIANAPSPCARVAWIDFCRVYCCLLVIMCHVYPSAGTWLCDFYTFHRDAHNYTFFLIAGYFVFSPASQSAFNIKRIIALVIPYLFWAFTTIVILSCLSILFAHQESQLACFAPLSFLANMGFMPWKTQHANIALWFLRSLIFFTIAAQFIRRLPTLYIIMLIGLAWVLLEMHNEFTELSNIVRPCAFIFFVSGMLLRRVATWDQVENKLTPWCWVAPLLSIALLLFIPDWVRPDTVLYSALGVVCILSIALFINRFAKALQKVLIVAAPACFFIYAHHAITDIIIFALLKRAHIEQTPCVKLLIVLFIFVLGWLLYLLTCKLCPRLGAFIALQPPPTQAHAREQ